jgi:alkylated DNA repair protein alkB family protein 6
MKFGKRRVAMYGETKDTPLVGLLQEIVKQGIFSSGEPPNQCLLNKYQPGQGILPCTDGPCYASRTATISLASSAVLDFTKRLSSDAIGNSKDSEDSGRIPVLLEPGSLIVFEEDA